MDAYEPTQIVFSRVQAFEPDNVSKIMGYLLLQDHGNQEMIRLAFGPDSLLQYAISNVKKELGLASYQGLHLSTNAVLTEQFTSELSPHSPVPLRSSNEVSPQFSLLSPQILPQQLSPDAISHPSLLQSEGPYLTQNRPWPSPLYIPDSHSYLQFNPSSPWENGTKVEQSPNNISLHYNQYAANVLSPTNSRTQQLQNALGQQDFLASALLYEQHYQLLSSPLSNKTSSSKFTGRLASIGVSAADGASSLAWKPCLYFARGFCKHGSSCRFLHGSVKEGSASSSPRSESRDSHGDDGPSSGSLERLEQDLQELLRGRRTPVSIASLPQLYYERFGKTLQADGYLTESQRHGKAGYSLTKLLARLKNTITLIDRPHGQHAVVLAEDAEHYILKGEQEELKATSSSSRQIYLTFPAESTFTEDDVTLHFRAYGHVQDVRIPYQQRRMFGFVTFAYPETVKQILSEGNPHYICGARVLVKPYREKSKPKERNYSSKNLFYTLHCNSGSNDFNTQALAFSNDSYLRKLQEENVKELQRKLTELPIEDTSEVVTMAHDGLQSAMKRNLARVYKAEIGSPSLSDSLENMYISEPSRTISAANYLAHDVQRFPLNDTFEYLLDVLDSDVGEDVKSFGANYGTESINNGYNLPQNPFTSPTQSMDKSTLPMDVLCLDSKSQIGELSAAHEVNNATCCICSDYFENPIQLDCSHIFCLQCILQVIKSSKDECPVCQKHLGSQNFPKLSLEKSQSAAQQTW